MFYEVMYIIPNKYSEDEAKEIKTKVNNLAASEGFAIAKDDTMGKRKLAYPIKQNYFGYYELLYLKNDNEGNLAAFGQKLKIMPEILRHQIIKYKNLPEPAVKANIINNPNEIAKDAGKEEKEAVAVQAAPEKTSIEEKKETKKVDLKELDKKLDELLENVDV